MANAISADSNNVANILLPSCWCFRGPLPLVLQYLRPPGEPENHLPSTAIRARKYLIIDSWTVIYTVTKSLTNIPVTTVESNGKRCISAKVSRMRMCISAKSKYIIALCHDEVISFHVQKNALNINLLFQIYCRIINFKK